MIYSSSGELLDEPLAYDSITISGVGGSTSYSDPLDVIRRQRNVRTVIGFLARNVAQVGLHVFGLDANGDRRRLRDNESRYARWAKQPSAGETYFETIRDLMTDLCGWERYAALKVIDAENRVWIERIDPRFWRFVRTGAGRITGIRILRTNQIVPESQLFYLAGYPGTEKAPLQHLYDLLVEEAESNKHRTELWRNGARMSGWIERPDTAPPWTKNARDRFRARFADAYTSGGSRAGGIPVLEEGMQFHAEAGLTPHDAQQIDARKLTITEVAAAFFVPAMFVGVTDDANYSNAKEFRQLLYSDTLGPFFQQIAQAANLRIGPELDPEAFAEFNVGEKLRLSFEEQAKVMQTAVGGPVMTRNEARGRLNLPRLDDPSYDELIVPMNVTAGGQASPTDTHPNN